ncbi:CBS domain-containing protein CBSCBSPB1-like protein isoform X1, partial [Tanacetum coccineum]
INRVHDDLLEKLKEAKRPYVALDDVPPCYADAEVRQSRLCTDYKMGGRYSQYGHAYTDRLGRSNIGYGSSRSSMSDQWGLTRERIVKRLRLSKDLTVPETTTIYEAYRRMAARKVDALLVTDSIYLQCGIFMDKDIDFENTLVSKVMTRNPIFVLADTLAVEALQKMVQGRSRAGPWPVVIKYEGCVRLCLKNSKGCPEARVFLKDNCSLLRTAFGLDQVSDVYTKLKKQELVLMIRAVILDTM